jgi:hypothetical protein
MSFVAAGMLPPRRDDGGPFDWWHQVRPRFFAGFHECLPAFAVTGNDLIVEHVIELRSWRADLAVLLADLDVFLVGVHCTPDELDRRERIRGDRRSDRFAAERMFALCAGRQRAALRREPDHRCGLSRVQAFGLTGHVDDNGDSFIEQLGTVRVSCRGRRIAQNIVQGHACVAEAFRVAVDQDLGGHPEPQRRYRTAVLSGPGDHPGPRVGHDVGGIDHYGKGRFQPRRDASIHLIEYHRIIANVDAVSEQLVADGVTGDDTVRVQPAVLNPGAGEGGFARGGWSDQQDEPARHLVVALDNSVSHGRRLPPAA